MAERDFRFVHINFVRELRRVGENGHASARDFDEAPGNRQRLSRSRRGLYDALACTECGNEWGMTRENA